MQKSSALAALYGSKTDPLKSMVQDLIENEQDPGTHAVRRACTRSHSTTTVANVVLAVAINNPHKAHSWLHPITRPFSKPSWRKSPSPTEQYYLGVVLGMFQAVNWIDEHWRTPTEFDAMLCHVIEDVVFSDVPKIKKFPRGYETLLSQEIKRYIRGSENFQWKRLAQITNTLDEVVDRFERLEWKDENLTSLGYLVLDQLNYAMLGKISLRARVVAVNSVFDKLLAVNNRQSKAS